MFGAKMWSNFSAVTATDLVPYVGSGPTGTEVANVDEDASMEENGEVQPVETSLSYLMTIFESMQESLLQIAEYTGIVASAELAKQAAATSAATGQSLKDAQAAQERNFARSQGGEGDEGGVLDTLKGLLPSGGMGDKMKLLLLVTGLFALSKYAEKIIPKLAKTLDYFKNDLLPKLENLFDVVDDETGEIKWTKILGMGLGAYVALKIGPALLGLVFKTPLGLKVAGIAGLAIWAYKSALQITGDAIAAQEWTAEEGATDNTIANMIGGALGGDIEGGIVNAMEQAGKWAGPFALIGAGIGSVIPVVGTIAGALIGGAIGLVFGGIMGFIGGGKIAKFFDDISTWVSTKWNNLMQGIKDIFFDREVEIGPEGQGFGTMTQRSGIGQIADKIQQLEDDINAWFIGMWEKLTGWIPSVDDIKAAGGDLKAWTEGIVDDIKLWFWDGSKPQIIGIDLSNIKEAMPSVEELKASIFSVLPEWLQPDTIEEAYNKQMLKEAAKADFFDKDRDLFFGVENLSELDKSKIGLMSADHLKAILALESDDLRQEDIQYLKDQIAIKTGEPYSELDKISSQNGSMTTKTIDLKEATKDNTEYKTGGHKGLSYGGSNNIMLNQGDNYVSKQENISIEKKVRHLDSVPHILSRYQFN